MDEEGLTKLPDGTLLSYDVFNSVNTGVSTAQRYTPSTQTWADATGTTSFPVLSSSADGYELGPQLLLQNGKVLVIGANNNTALYTLSTGNWAAGPTLPTGMGADDAPGAELPNGQVIFAADHPLFGTPSQIFDYNPSTNAITTLTLPTSLATRLNSEPSYIDRMLVLPTGQVLFSDATKELWIYTPPTGASSSVQPVVTGVANNGGGNFTLTGTQLNGQNAGAVYGDDAEMDSNFPTVRLRSSTGTVFYCRTTNWSTTGVQTGIAVETVNFAIPSGVVSGTTYSLLESGAGINSKAFSFTAPVAFDLSGVGGAGAHAPVATQTGSSIHGDSANLGRSGDSSAVPGHATFGASAGPSAATLQHGGSDTSALDLVFAKLFADEL
jgi:hypothetical protein